LQGGSQNAGNPALISLARGDAVSSRLNRHAIFPHRSAAGRRRTRDARPVSEKGRYFVRPRRLTDRGSTDRVPETPRSRSRPSAVSAFTPSLPVVITTAQGVRAVVVVGNSG
jgi:hypothetical protein